MDKTIILSIDPGTKTGLAWFRTCINFLQNKDNDIPIEKHIYLYDTMLLNLESYYPNMDRLMNNTLIKETNMITSVKKGLEDVLKDHDVPNIIVLEDVFSYYDKFYAFKSLILCSFCLVNFFIERYPYISVFKIPTKQAKRTILERLNKMGYDISKFSVDDKTSIHEALKILLSYDRDILVGKDVDIYSCSEHELDAIIVGCSFIYNNLYW